MTNLRTKGKSTIVWILMGLLILGLGGFGVTSFSGGSSDVGSVGSTKVTADDYALALQSELNKFAQQTGQQFNMVQAQAIGLPQSVLSQLFTSAALEEQTRRYGISVGDEQVAKVIAAAPAFRGPNGSFDRTAYAQILNRQNMSEAEFESEIRLDEARLILNRAVASGVSPSNGVLEFLTGWWLEERDFSWRELTEADLETQPEPLDEAALTAWHEANSDRFTAPETRKLTYVWITPEMLVDEVELDKAALRDLYEQRKDEYQRPERRLVSRLVFPSQDEAEAARARLDSGDVTFSELVEERGLTLEDIDLGEVTMEELDAAGEQAFALKEPGVIGPFKTGLGPALFSVNAILDPVNVTFEEAKDDLRLEAALDRAERMIDDQIGEYQDLLAGGASLEDLAEQTPLELQTLDWTSETESTAASIAGYPSFRDMASKAVEGDFPQIERLEDGGVYALRVDEVVAPALKPLDEVRDEVMADWRRAEVRKLLLARADKLRLELDAEPGTDGLPAPEIDASDAVASAPVTADPAPSENHAEAEPRPDWTSETDMTREGWIDGLPQEVIRSAFDLTQEAPYATVNAKDRVFLVRLDDITRPDLAEENAMRVMKALRDSLGQSVQSDLFTYYARAIQQRAGLQVNQSTIDAVNSQIR